MKTALLVLVLSLSALGEEPELAYMIPSPLNISCELQIIDVPALESIPVIEAIQDSANAEKSLTDLHALVEQKKATLVGVLYISTKSGNRAVAENIKEFRYPLLPREYQELLDHPLHYDFPYNPSTPTKIETRILGSILEFEPQIGPDGVTVESQFRAQRIYFNGMEKHTVVTNGFEKVVWQPQFSDNIVTTSLTFSNNKPVLVGSFNSPDKAGWTELFIMRVKIQRVP